MNASIHDVASIEIGEIEQLTGQARCAVRHIVVTDASGNVFNFTCFADAEHADRLEIEKKG